MIALETWAFDITVIMASFLGVVAFDSHVIILNAAAFTFVTFPLAIATAATIRTGNFTLIVLFYFVIIRSYSSFFDLI